MSWQDNPPPPVRLILDESDRCGTRCHAADFGVELAASMDTEELGHELDLMLAVLDRSDDPTVKAVYFEMLDDWMGRELDAHDLL